MGRVNITRQARDFAANGAVAGPVSLFPAAALLNSPEGYAFWRRHKAELFALAAVIGDGILKTAYRERLPPGEQLGLLDPRLPFQSLGASLGQQINRTAERELRRLAAGDGQGENRECSIEKPRRQHTVYAFVYAF